MVTERFRTSQPYISQATTSPTPQVHGSAHGKVILMGEHAVVYNYPAIALPFTATQVGVKVEASEDGQGQLVSSIYKGHLKQAPLDLLNIKTAIDLSLQAIQQADKGLRFHIQSAIPQARGMGSSAAVAVATVRAIFNYFQEPLSEVQLKYLVNQAEVIAHGSTSGIDTLVTSSSQPIIYQKSQAPHYFDLHLNAYLVVADTGLEGQTRSAVTQVQRLKAEKPHFVKECMTSIGQFVEKAYQAIQLGDAVELGRLMTYNHYYLNQLGVSTPAIDQLVNAAWLEGAYGAKLTGSGLGGCVIALAPDANIAQNIIQAMEQAGAKQTWMTSLTQTHLS